MIISTDHYVRKVLIDAKRIQETIEKEESKESKFLKQSDQSRIKDDNKPSQAEIN